MSIVNKLYKLQDFLDFDIECDNRAKFYFVNGAKFVVLKSHPNYFDINLHYSETNYVSIRKIPLNLEYKPHNGNNYYSFQLAKTIILNRLEILYTKYLTSSFLTNCFKSHEPILLFY